MAFEVKTAFVSVLGLLLLSLGASADQCDRDTLRMFKGAGSVWPKELDWGIYWYSEDGFEKATGYASKHYVPSRKTLIYFHGWTGNGVGSTARCARDTDKCPPEVCSEGSPKLFDKYYKSGWNVGIFYWDQFADEVCPRQAEKKLYYSGTKGQGLSYRVYDPATGVKSDKRLQVEQTGGKYLHSVSELCVAEFDRTMEHNFVAKEIHFIGHDLGAQLAVRCGAKLRARQFYIVPRRVTMLEPYYGHDALPHDGCEASNEEQKGDFNVKFPASHARVMLESVVEIYKSSSYTREMRYGNPNEFFKKEAVFVDIDSANCGGPTNPGTVSEWFTNPNYICRNKIVLPAYLFQYMEEGSKLQDTKGLEYTENSAFGVCPVPWSGCPVEALKAWRDRQVKIGGSQQWAQVVGGRTVNFTDDRYTLLSPPSNGEDVMTEDVFKKYALPHQDKYKAMLWRMIRTRSLVPQLYVPVYILMGTTALVGVLTVLCWLGYVPRQLNFCFGDGKSNRHDDWTQLREQRRSNRDMEARNFRMDSAVRSESD
eukprot:TRINITY_DN48605_c0_g1_i1.p1 TRINITY_DN48605_c0_g1~~TRINITY_DN48605_c0_g1_i1.p1  ORF type:complete len:558 (+),score=80.43 TRINITY_DN48605_c0_g1_i1:63-1676(+)